MTKGRQKTFTDQLNERIDAAELQRLQKAAELEEEYFANLKKELNAVVRAQMAKKNIGMSKLAHLLCCSDGSDARTLRLLLVNMALPWLLSHVLALHWE